MKKISFAVLLLSLLFLTSCTSSDVRKRAFGYFRIGDVKNFPVNSTQYLSNDGLLIRHDEGGVSAMSTLCTFDLAPLTFSGKEFSSPYSSSKHDMLGLVLHGPDKANLPFYKVLQESALFGGPKDTLYVKVGVEVSNEWRLKIQ